MPQAVIVHHLAIIGAKGDGGDLGTTDRRNEARLPGDLQEIFMSDPSSS